jgi:Fe-S oxidoreductase
MTAPAQVTIMLDDARWDKVAEATGNKAAPCFQCGTCTATCPWGLVAGPTIGVRSIVRKAQLGIDGWADDVWRCTTCGACESQCPHQVPIGQVMVGLRSLSWREGSLPEGLSSVMWDVYWDGNSWGRPPSERSRWAAGLDIQRFDPSVHDFLLYIGCTASYDRRAQKIARSVVSLLRTAGVAFGTLGDDEPCCGDPVRALGNDAYFHQLATANAELFASAGVTNLVTISPHCYDTFARHYPDLPGSVRIQHYATVLEELVAAGRLAFEGIDEQRVTFHDPCYLSRHQDETQPPRSVLNAISGIELTEMGRSGASTLCCGGGGGRMWMETPAGERFGDSRVREAAATGATKLVTTCPHCVACLEDAISVTKTTDLSLLDLSEMAMLARPYNPGGAS